MYDVFVREFVFFSSILYVKDTFKLFQIIDKRNVQVPFDGKGIAWWTDYNIKYRNPSTIPLRNAFNGKKKHNKM